MSWLLEAMSTCMDHDVKVEGPRLHGGPRLMSWLLKAMSWSVRRDGKKALVAWLDENGDAETFKWSKPLCEHLRTLLP